MTKQEILDLIIEQGKFPVNDKTDTRTAFYLYELEKAKKLISKFVIQDNIGWREYYLNKEERSDQ